MIYAKTAKSKLTSKYGTGRFCSEKCARGYATKSRRKEINIKVSKTLSGRNTLKETKTEQEYKDIHKKSGITKHKQTFARINKDILDVTKGYLDKYMSEHTVCEICGRKNPKSYNLCIDHDHNTKHFRGVLCFQCNRALGWFENNQKSVLDYLSQHSSSV